MLAYVTEPITIPPSAIVGMDPPIEGSAQRVAIRLEMTVRRDLVEPLYYHKRSDDPAIGR